MFWIVVAAMMAVVGSAIALPFLRGGATARPAAAFDLQVYRDQLREVDRDRARGVLTAEDADRLRTEIGRKVLEADRALAAGAAGAGQGRSGGPAGGPGGGPGGVRAGNAGALVLLAAAILGSAALYALMLGAPARPDDPLAARIAAAAARYDNRPTQAAAEAAAPAPQVPPAEPGYARLVEQLRATVAERPDDVQGLALLAQHEATLGNLSAARAAQERLIAVRGNGATAADHAALAGLMAQAAGGIITRDAEAEIDRALQLDPANPDARFLRGLLLAQNGRPDRTFPIWADLLATAPADLPWMQVVRTTIADLAWLAGQPDYVPPEAGTAPAPMPGPDAAAIADAEALSPEERQLLVGDMVSRLESRLAAQGGTPEEWARLISAVVVMGDIDHAREIWTEAQARFAANPPGLATVTDAARRAGLADNAAVAPGLPGPDAAAVEAAERMTDEERAEMIAGMVQRLRDRLTTQGGSGAEWARLVAALSVQGDGEGASEMLARGRGALAGDADGLAALDAAAARAGLE
ncbi:c-type cytochrome biogenesis protein CcmI [Paracoccus aeridis]|uniref:c-type cytochrome biogenesis protein CcmI n=1 Tax=Paracoccus aeridis TaxID=1966466 RepID=UPI0010AAAC17|nr:c-type cytochrome biogenesis protein CcmI [Paracoccus aeridis]